MYLHPASGLLDPLNIKPWEPMNGPMAKAKILSAKKKNKVLFYYNSKYKIDNPKSTLIEINESINQ